MIDAKTFEVLDYLLVGRRVWQLAFTPDQKQLLATNGVSGDVSVIDVESRKVLKSVKVGRYPGAWWSRHERPGGQRPELAYGTREALKQMNFSLPAGRFAALLGPNGAGKSTLIALLTRLYDLQRGEIRIGGHSLQNLRVRPCANWAWCSNRAPWTWT